MKILMLEGAGVKCECLFFNHIHHMAARREARRWSLRCAILNGPKGRRFSGAEDQPNTLDEPIESALGHKEPVVGR